MKKFTSHPTVGDVIREMYLHPTQMNAQEAADLCGLDCAMFEAILSGQQALNYQLAYRLAQGFNTSYTFWLGIQATHKKAPAQAEAD